MSVFPPIDKILCWSAATQKLSSSSSERLQIYNKGRTYDASFHKVSRLPFRRITPLYHVVSAKSLQLDFFIGHSSTTRIKNALNPISHGLYSMLTYKVPRRPRGGLPNNYHQPRVRLPSSRHNLLGHHNNNSSSHSNNNFSPRCPTILSPRIWC